MVLLQHSSPQICLNPTPKYERAETGLTVLRRSAENPGSSSVCPRGRTVPGCVLPPFLSPKEKRCLAPGNRSDVPEQIHKARKIQNGDSVNNPASHSTRRLDDFNRPERCLFSCASGKRLFKVPPVPYQARTSSIHLPTVRVDNFSSSFHQSPPGRCGPHQAKRCASLPLSRRSPSSVSKQRTAPGAQRTSDLNPFQLWMASKLGKKPPGSSPTFNLLRGSVQHSREHHLPAGREDSGDSEEDFSCSGCSSSESITMPKNHRHNGLHNPHGQMGSMEVTPVPVRVPPAMEVRGQESADPHIHNNEKQPLLVAPTQKFAELSLHCPHLLGYSHDRRQRLRLGGSLWSEPSSGQMGRSSSQPRLKRPGAQGGLVRPPIFLPVPERRVGIVTDGQHNSSVVCEEARRDPEFYSPSRGRAHNNMGPEKPGQYLSSFHSGSPELPGRLPLTYSPRQQRVVPPCTVLQLDSVSGSQSRSGPICFPPQSQNSEVLFSGPLQPGSRNGCPDGQMEVQAGICFSPDPDNPQVLEETSSGISRNNSSGSLLAKQALVSPPDPTELPGPGTSSSQAGPSLSRVTPTPLSSTNETDGLVLERERLESLGCASRVISTLLSSRRTSTNKIYGRIWARFVEFSSASGRPFRNPGVQDVLSFLQTGLDLPLSVSSLRVQVSALSAFSGISWAVHPLVRQFFRGASRIKPQRKPRFPKWDLPLVLDSLSGLSTTGPSPSSIKDFSAKVAFLVAITSAKRVSEIGSLGHEEPFLTFFPDRVVLIPLLGSNPKVSSVFHENQEIVLPTFKTPESNDTHPLDIGKILKEYLEITSPFRRSDHLFILHSGSNKGKKASIRTIASWIVQTIQQAYRAKGLAPPQAVTAHSTRGMAASWAAARHVAPDVICKAASWASINTFMAHYCIEPASLSSVNFGLRILSVDGTN